MSYDAVGVEKAVRDLLIAIGENPDREGLRETPQRMARAYQQIFEGMEQDPREHLEKLFEVSHQELVLVKDIAFYSMCEHHLLPFFGKAHVAYIPGHGKVTGLSKLARLVSGYAARAQVQERLTQQIAQAIEETLMPQGVAVVLNAEHMCMTMRGVQKPGSKTLTSAVRGIIRSNAATRAEVMSLIISGGD